MIHTPSALQNSLSVCLILRDVSSGSEVDGKCPCYAGNRAAIEVILKEREDCDGHAFHRAIIPEWRWLVGTLEMSSMVFLRVTFAVKPLLEGFSNSDSIRDFQMRLH
jgi:hypothetical protein